MKLLILGGTQFLGRHIVESALSHGHTVTLFNRGCSNPDIFPDVEKLRGDRNVDANALRGRTWDAVLDTSGFLPQSMKSILEILKGSTAHYSFVSSLTIYADLTVPDVPECAPTVDVDPYIDDSMVTPQSYGPLKLLCEKEVQLAFGDDALIARPGLIVGPHDYTNRSAYWVERIAEGGQVLAPGSPSRRIQLIDARDVADWLIQTSEAGQSGVFNVGGPERVLTMGEFLETCVTECSSNTSLVWLDDQFLRERDVAYWSELPLWLAESVPFRLDVSAAVRAGLRFRPLSVTIADVYSSIGSRRRSWPIESVWSSGGTVDVGMAREKEASILAEWEQLSSGRHL